MNQPSFHETIMGRQFFERDVREVKESLKLIEHHLGEANHLKRRELELRERELELMAKAMQNQNP